MLMRTGAPSRLEISKSQGYPKFTKKVSNDWGISCSWTSLLQSFRVALCQLENYELRRKRDMTSTLAAFTASADNEFNLNPGSISI
eukprot:s151_g37.t1